MSLASTSPNSTIKNTVMAAHADGTLEYWHTTSNQLLFQKKVTQNINISIKYPYIAAKLVVIINGMLYQQKMVRCYQDIQIKVILLFYKLVNQDHMLIVFFVLNGILRILIVFGVGVGIKLYLCGMFGLKLRLNLCMDFLLVGKLLILRIIRYYQVITKMNINCVFTISKQIKPVNYNGNITTNTPKMVSQV